MIARRHYKVFQELFPRILRLREKEVETQMRLFFGLLITILALEAMAEASVAGLWASDGSIISVEVDGTDLTATVVALMEPNYLEDEAEFGVPGSTRLDHLNPDDGLRTRPVLGIELTSEYTFDGKRWSGKIYDPESGNTYSSRMRVDKDGNLAMRGYIGMPMLGRTAIFEPIAMCKNHMQEMLGKAGLPSCG